MSVRELRALPAFALFGIAAACASGGAGRPESMPVPAAGQKPAQAASRLVLPKPDSPTALTEDHFVTKWLCLGPFTFGEMDFGGDPQTGAADKEFMPGEGALDGTQAAPVGTAWKEKDFPGVLPGQVNLDAFYGGIDRACAYGVAWLNAPEDIANATLFTGSDDYIKVWINGKLVHTYKTDRRASEWDQDRTDGVALKKGWNRVVVKCVDVIYDWDFYLRFATSDGKPILVKPE